MNSIDIVKYLETKYPKEAAYEWDNVGLQVGSLNHRVKKVLVTLDVTREVVEEAINQKAELIISHHPLIFKPMMNVSIETPRGWMIHHLIKHGISLYSMHTNYDVASEGMNADFAERLGLVNLTVLDETENIGLVGEMTPVSFSDFVEQIKTQFQLLDIKLIGKPRETIQKIGFSLGSGSHHMAHAKRKNCDLFLTGDMTYHSALDAIQMGLSVLDIGHHAESIFKETIQKKLSIRFPEIEFVLSSVNTNPYQSL